MKILVNQLKNIGDVLLAMPAISLIRQKYPEAWITLMVVEHVAPFFSGHPLIDAILPLNYNSKEKNFFAMRKMVRTIRREEFDLNISLDSRLRPLLLTAFAGISLRIGGDGMDRYQGDKEWYRFAFTKLVPITEQGLEHQSETFMKVVRGGLEVAAEVDGKAPSLPPITQEARQRAEVLLGSAVEHSLRKKVLFSIRGTWPGKNWSPQKFIQVIDEASQKFAVDCYIVGAEADFEYAEEICRVCQANVVNLCGKTVPQDLYAVFQAADLLVSVDTGLGHIAAALGLPLVSIFISTNPIQWHPLTKNGIILCEEYAYRRFKLTPEPWTENYQEIFPQQVLNAMEKVLNGQAGEVRRDIDAYSNIRKYSYAGGA